MLRRARGAFALLLPRHLLMALAVVAGGCDPSRPSAASPQHGAGLEAGSVSFELPSDGGALVPIPQPSSRLTVVDAFGPTCAPCREKVPALLARREELAAKGAKLVLVAVLGDGETTDSAAAALRDWGAPSPFLVDRGNVLTRLLGMKGLPATYVVRSDGAVVWEAPPDASADDVVGAVAAEP